MSSFKLDDLLGALSELSADTSLSEALRAVRPKRPEGRVEATKQCALVRWFDQSLYDWLCKGVENRPPFEEFISYPEVSRLGPDRWSIEDGERTRLLAQWQAEPHGWRRRNTKIGYYFVKRGDPEAQLAAVYHLAASTVPERVIPFFRRWFARADEAFDMAQCNALLEMLRLQESWRGERVSHEWREFNLYYTARLLFVDDYYKTGSYFERPQLLENFLSVFDRKLGKDVWIFHLHATGGAGKTMFLRWLTGRRLVLDRIICAKVDFDDFKLEEVRTYPTGLFRRLVSQFVQQPKGDALAPLLERLQREQKIQGWNPDVTKEIRRQLRGANIDGPVVVMLDTLEQATLSAAKWLEACVDALRTVHDEFPNLTLVLSGRYDISERCDALRDGEFLDYDLPRFSEYEARQYLKQRGVPDGPLRGAIVERAEEKEESSRNTDTPPIDQLTGCNPFKLAMFAELALNRKNLTVEEVRRFPRVDIAYLVERIIRRIDSQPIRWMIRYGAIARQLTLEFAEHVLLPPLLQALRGQPSDDAAKGLEGFEDPLDGKIDVWTPDPDSVAVLEQDGIKDLWDELARYAREKGWLTAVLTNGQSELHFHPEVLNPTRALLREQPVFGELQNSAATFFEKKARAEPEANTAVRYYRDAIFHYFQGEGAKAKPFWTGHLREAVARFGPAAALPVATEILGSEYSEAERIPYPEVSSAELLLSAHCETAELLMQAAGLEFAEPASRNEFNRHIEIGREIVGEHPDLKGAIPVYLDQIFQAWLSGSAEKAAAFLRAAIRDAQDTRHSFMLEFQLAGILLRYPSADTPTHLREALRLLPEAGLVGVTETDLYLALASYYMFRGAHAAVIEAMSSAGRSAGDLRARARVLDHEAWYAVAVGDIPTARKRMTELRKLPYGMLSLPSSPQLLEGRLAIMESEPFGALRACEQGLAAAATANERARLLDQRAEARALLLEFRAASDDWNSAATSYDLASVSSGPARCALLSAAMTAREMQDYRRAQTQIESALSLRGSVDVEILTELRLLLAFVLCRTDQQEKARQILSELIERPSIPPHIHARVLIFALSFGLRKTSDDFLEDVLETVSKIQPIGRATEALEWIKDADRRVDVPQDFVTRLVGQLARPNSELASGIELMIRRADLYRVFGRVEDAAKELDRASAGWLKDAATEFKASEGRLLRAWRLNLARKRLGQTDTRFGSLLERARSTKLAGSSLYGAILCEAADEALRAGDAAAAKNTLDAYSPPTELPNIWQARRADLLAQLATLGDRPRLRREAAELYQALGQPAPPGRSASPEPREMESGGNHRIAREMHDWQPPEAIAISRFDLPPPLIDAAGSHEIAIDSLCADWVKFASELRNVLRSRKAEDAPITLTMDIAALPWELGGAGTRCRQTGGFRSPRSMANDRWLPGAVQLLIPSEGEWDIRVESASGFSLAGLYSHLGAVPIANEVRDIDLLYKALNGRPPELLHVVAAVREGDVGVYLDFASTTRRVISVESQSSYGGAEVITAKSLSTLLRSLPLPPFVVLDITHPRNEVEAVRMMLLRNIFAAELFEFGAARGVLACGLGQPWEREVLSAKIVEALLSECVGASILRLRAEPPRDLGHVLPRHAAALWTDDPNDRLFTP